MSDEFGSAEEEVVRVVPALANPTRFVAGQAPDHPTRGGFDEMQDLYGFQHIGGQGGHRFFSNMS